MKMRVGILMAICLLSWQQVTAAEKNITLDEVKAHNNPKNCWIIVEAKVYDVTHFIESHDSKCKETKLTDYCGKDATTIWLDKQKTNNTHKRKSVLEFERSQVGVLKNP